MLTPRIFVNCDICDAVTPLAWAGPEDGTNSNDPVSRPAKKQTTQSVLRNDALIKTEGRT